MRPGINSIPNSRRAKIAGRNCKKIKTELLDDQDRRAGEQDRIATLSTYPKYGQHTRNMVNRPEIWSTDQKYGQQTKNMVNIPEILSPHQKYGQG